MADNLRQKILMALLLPLTMIGLACCTLPAFAGALPTSSQVATTPVKAPTSLPQVQADQNSLKTILSIAFGIIGSLAVLMIVISGVKYITSGGDPQKAAEAKHGIMFALIGLIIAILAQAIVAFVVNRI